MADAKSEILALVAAMERAKATQKPKVKSRDEITAATKRLSGTVLGAILKEQENLSAELQLKTLALVLGILIRQARTDNDPTNGFLCAVEVCDLILTEAMKP